MLRRVLTIALWRVLQSACIYLATTGHAWHRRRHRRARGAGCTAPVKQLMARTARMARCAGRRATCKARASRAAGLRLCAGMLPGRGNGLRRGMQWPLLLVVLPPVLQLLLMLALLMLPIWWYLPGPRGLHL